ncbi:MAG: sterol desaturase family protein [Alphaproteobacteria bacterium]|nr:sterol desaturase family protein [Alphaproteobacteria bacterium]
MRRALSYILWPALLSAAITVNALGMTTGMPLLWLNVSYFGLALVLFVLERLMPHEPAWLADDGQLIPDIGHTLLSKSAVQVLIIVPALTGLSGHVDALQGSSWWPHAWPLPVQILLGLLIAEFGFYWAHRWGHEWPVMWRYHAIHHSVTRLWFVNTGRFHFVNTLLSTTFGLVLVLLAGAPSEVIIWGSAITAYVGLLTHANVEMRTGVLDYVFNTPGLHRWHHSKVLDEGNRNYGENLMIFDLMFRTFYKSPRRPPVDIGIQQPMPATLMAQIAWPFRRHPPFDVPEERLAA